MYPLVCIIILVRKNILLYFKLSNLETLDDDQSVYKRIVDRLEDLQQFHQLLVIRIVENGIHDDLKTFESKQKGIFNNVNTKRSFGY